MSDRRTRMALRLYAPAWRARYGDEVEALIDESCGGEISWRLWLDVAWSGVCQRLRATATIAGGASPDERSRGGALVVLSAWVMITVAGLVVQKTSEQWQAATGGSTVFDVVKLAAGIGSAMILTGIAAAVPALARYVRAGGWNSIRGPICRAGAVTITTGAATVGLVIWARQISAAQRNGGNVTYSLAFLACAMLIVTSLVMWAAAAIATGRRLELSPRVVRLHGGLAVGVATSMLVITAATVVWWAQTDVSTAWVMTGCAATMALATALAGAGAVRAVR